jgi:riboflavin biosynthesis pyrimidine reductase
VNRLETIFERPGQRGEGMPERLREMYGGDLAIASETVYGNFVTSIDGVAALRSEVRSSASIGGGNAGDRLVMGLLRAWADVVLVGAGTLRSHPGGLWTPAQAYPSAAEDFSELRRNAGLAPVPRLAILSASGQLDPREPSLGSAMIITTSAGRRRLDGRLPTTADVLVPRDSDFGPPTAVKLLRSRGCGRVLTEGGPTVMAGLVGARALDELFLTISPLLVGRVDAASRPGLIDGLALEPSRFVEGSLMSLRRHGSHLFLRYELPVA